MSKIYIQSMPKAGTYFFGAVLEKLGLVNSGFHVHENFVQHTLAYSDEVNRERPTETHLGLLWSTIMPALKEKSFCFGHFPASFLTTGFPLYKFIIAYRDPFETLTSEFVDFRFRRRDSSWLSPSHIEDNGEAFETYLVRGALNRHYRHLLDVIELRRMVLLNIAPQNFPPEKFSFFDFKKARENPEEIARLAEFATGQRSRVDYAELLNAVLSTDTKTKATGLDIDKKSFWTSGAQQLYKESGFPDLMNQAREVKLFS